MIKLIALLLLTLSINAFAHKGHHHEIQSSEEKLQSKNLQEKENLKIISQKYEQNIQAIFQQKCLDCHEGTGSFPWYHKLPLIGSLIQKDRDESVKHLNMSKGFPFGGHGTNLEDLEAIAESISENSMPPFRYRILHWNSSLNENEKSLILNWANDSKLQLAK